MRLRFVEDVGRAVKIAGRYRPQRRTFRAQFLQKTGPPGKSARGIGVSATGPVIGARVAFVKQACVRQGFRGRRRRLSATRGQREQDRKYKRWAHA
jgi:hypothetical protein